MATAFLFILVGAVMNCARGRRLFGFTESTSLGRFVALGIIACAACAISGSIETGLTVYVGLIFWATFAWGTYMGACVGGTPDFTRNGWPPVEWLLKTFKVPQTPLIRWGVIAFGLRGLLGMYPLFIALGVLGHGFAPLLGLLSGLQGVVYAVAGKLVGPARGVALAEVLYGALYGALIYFSVT